MWPPTMAPPSQKVDCYIGSNNKDYVLPPRNILSHTYKIKRMGERNGILVLIEDLTDALTPVVNLRMKILELKNYLVVKNYFS